ncbi:protein kinase [Gracilaria domingensis]|nr:protein kinase [Gracilaria domingensis]
MNFEGQVLKNRWVIGPQIGAGGFGVVHQAEDNTNVHANAVVKLAYVQDADLSEDELEDLVDQAGDDLMNEVEKLQDLGSRAPDLSVPKVFDSDLEADTPFLVMTKFGDTVDTLHEAADLKFSNSEIIVIVRQVFQIIRAMHGLGVTHGDVKEGNVARGLGAEQNKFFLIDFGASKDIVLSSPATDVGDLLDMMVRLFRGGGEGLVPAGEMDDYIWSNLSEEQVQTLMANFEDAVQVRNNQAMPIPDPIKALVHEVVDQAPPNYERMNALLAQAYTQTVDPNQPLFS